MTDQASEGLDWRELSALFDHALDLDDAQRRIWIADLQTTRPQVAAGLHRMLAERDALDANGFLTQSPFTRFAPSLAGVQAGAYTIERLIGRGGMGEVWLAHRTDGRFEGSCALKFLDAAHANERLAERFRREGMLLGRLAHPNIARLLDAGTANGRAYLALEYVEGERIDQYCEKLSVPQRVRLFVDVVGAVAHAHSLLIVHRDLKPSNVLVTRDGQVKLLDFGVAKLLHAAPEAGGDDLTHLEDVALTPEYAAPEQLLGEAPTTATDVFQLGMLLYVLLTGHHPIRTIGTRADRIRAALDGTVPRASELAGELVGRQLRGDLDAILAVALRKDPAERYPTAQTFKDELSRYLQHEPVLARRGAALYRLRKFVDRHRAGVLLSTLAIAGLIAVMLFAIVQMREAQAQRDQAKFEADRASTEASFMNLMMSELGEPGKPVTPDLVLSKGLDLLEKNFSAQPTFVAEMLIRMSGRFLEMGLYERELDALVRAENIARRQNDAVLLARVQCYTVETEISLGRLDRAAARVIEGLKIHAGRGDIPVIDQLICLKARADLEAGNGKTQEARTTLTDVVDRFEANNLTTHVDYISAADRLRDIYMLSGDMKSAYVLLRKIRAAREAGGAGQSMGAAAGRHNEALVLWSFGELDEAFAEESQVIDAFLAQGGDDALPLNLSVLYGTMLAQLDRTGDAQQWFDRALRDSADSSDVRGRMNLHVARSMHALESGRPSEAARELALADQLAEAGGPALSVLAARADMARAALLLESRQVGEARKVLTALRMRLLDTRQGLYVLYPEAEMLLSRIEAEAGKLAEAMTHAQAALDAFTQRARDPARSAWVGEAALQMARLKYKAGDTTAARKLLEQATTALSDVVGADHLLMKSAAAFRAQIDANLQSTRTGAPPM
jgi:eukaryotic-like serine/threonine-protein kinase